MGSLFVRGTNCRSVYSISKLEVELFFVIFSVILFVFWTLNKVMVYKCGMYPVIKQTKDLLHPDENEQNTNMNNNVERGVIITDNCTNQMIELTPHGNNAVTTGKQAALTSDQILTLKLSKRLDKNNEFRIRQRGQIYFTKTIFIICLFILFVFILFDHPKWYIDFFWNLDKCSVHYIYLKYIMILTIAYYFWETIMLEIYYNNQKSTYLHHWLSIFAGSFILYGLYWPFAVAHLLFGVAFAGIMIFGFGVRYNYCEKYPELTRIIMNISFINYVICLISVICSDIFILVRLFNIGYGDDTIPLHSAIIAIIFTICWLYDDYQLLKTLNKWKHESYEHVTNIF
eukprot:29140_1